MWTSKTSAMRMEVLEYLEKPVETSPWPSVNRRTYDIFLKSSRAYIQ